MKTVYVIVMVAALLVIAGCSKGSTASSTGPSAPSAPAPTAPSTPSPMEKLDDLAAVFGMTGDFKCTMTADDGQGNRVTATTYVKNGKVRTIMPTQAGEVNSLYDGDNIYTWTPQGCFKMSKADMERLAAMGQQAAGQAPKTQSREDLARGSADVDCKRESVSSSLMTPPSPCQDMGAMLAQLEQMQSGGGVPQMPAGYDYPTG